MGARYQAMPVPGPADEVLGKGSEGVSRRWQRQLARRPTSCVKHTGDLL